MWQSVARSMACGAVLGCLVSSAASADPVRIIDNRHATGVIFSDANGQRSDVDSGSELLASSLTSTGAATATGTATLTSVIVNPLQWFAFGLDEVAISSQEALFSYQAFTRFDRRFEITAPLTFTFAAEFAGATTPGGTSTWSAQLVRDLGDSLQTIFAEQGTGSVLRDFRGTLAPGQYALLVAGASLGQVQGPGTAAARAGFDFNFDLHAVPAAATPEPASLLLLATGVGGLAARRRQTAGHSQRK